MTNSMSKRLFPVMLCALFPLTLWSQDAGPGASLVHPFAPGDAINITVFPDSARQLTGVYPIDDQGYVNLPKVGLLNVTTFTDSQLVTLIKTSFVEYLRYPNVQVRPLIRVGMTGGYNQPGLLFADPRSNIWELVSRAGGTKRADGLNLIQWQRGDTVLSKKLLNPIVQGTSLSALGVKSGDQFWVTDRPQMAGWDVFRDNVLPVMGFAVSAATASITVYLATENYKGNSNVSK